MPADAKTQLALLIKRICHVAATAAKTALQSDLSGYHGFAAGLTRLYLTRCFCRFQQAHTPNKTAPQNQTLKVKGDR